MKQLDVKEQARAFTGKDNWTTIDDPEAGLPSIRMSDGPNGLRIEKASGLGFPESHPATLYPTASLTACSFDRNLQYELGKHLARECMENNVQVLLGPGVNHKRSPLCGRSFEYYSEDPYLSGQLGAAYVNGVQDQGVGVSVKHFAANSREYGRMVQDSIVDERALMEIYLSQFEMIVKSSHPWTMMAAYNRLNGKYCCEHKELLDLARKWGFDGLFVSDWGAVPDPASSLAAGLNLEMPGGNHGSDEKILEGLDNGTVTEAMLEANTEALRTLVDRVSHPQVSNELQDRLAFAQTAAEQSAVLLKNEQILPLANTDSIALIGPFARTPRIQGTGSSKVNAKEADTIYDVMKKAHMIFSYAPGFTLSPETVDFSLEEQALALAEHCSKVVVIAGLPEGDEAEGYDRQTLSLPENQNHLIQRLAQVNRNLIVVLQCGAPVELPWINDAKAVLCMYLSGARGGQATVNLLTGSVNPSGKLAETWPMKLEDTPCYATFHNDLLQVQYRESIYTGYRYYEKANVKPLFPFGFGLSYTTFAYSNLTIDTSSDQPIVTATITNTGSLPGKEIVQCYVGKKDSRIASVVKQLKGFEKVELNPGESTTVAFRLDDRSFAYFDVNIHDWQTEAGVYQILIGSSSNDMRLEGELFRNGTLSPYSRIPLQYVQEACTTHGFTQMAFEKVLGHPIPEAEVRRPFTVNTSIQELQTTGLGRLIKKGINLFRSFVEMPGVTEGMVMEVPIRMALMGSDRVTWKTIDAIADLFNGKASIFKVLRTIKK